jgi:ketosteroid isomerase-like protein
MTPDRREFVAGWVFLTPPWVEENPQAQVETLLDKFHKAASLARFDDYFACLTEDAIFLGTDATERWTVAQFKAFVKPYFDKGKGWTYDKVERHILVSRDAKHASFDELLENASYGRCRGTGVARREGEGWKLEQNHLTIPIPNELSRDVVKLIRDRKK